MAQFTGVRIAVVATDGVEEVELTQPVAALKEEEAEVTILTPNGRPIQAFNHLDQSKIIPFDQTLASVRPESYDALLLPGGGLNADALRTLPEVKAFVRAFQEAGKPIAAICHAPWILISAELVKGRKLTSYHTIQDDVRNAGGKWVDKEVVEDGNWVTSRQPSDIPAFIQAFFKLLKKLPAAAKRS